MEWREIGWSMDHFFRRSHSAHMLCTWLAICIAILLLLGNSVGQQSPKHRPHTRLHSIYDCTAMVHTHGRVRCLTARSHVVND